MTPRGYQAGRRTLLSDVERLRTSTTARPADDVAWRFLALVRRVPASAWAAIDSGGPVPLRHLDRAAELAHPRPHPAVLGARLVQALAAATSHDEVADEVGAWCAEGWPRRWQAPSGLSASDRVLLLTGAAVAAAVLAEAAPPGTEEQRCWARVSHRLSRCAVHRAGPDVDACGPEPRTTVEP